nr:MAG TPA: anaerobic ribonucleoside triphosphate reductase [Bacteriophage sp.]
MCLMKVIKKDGTLEEYNEQKIINAIDKSAQRENFTFSQDEYGMICNRVLNEVDEEDFENDEVPVGFIHNIVEKTLLDLFPKVGYQYQQYRNYKLDFVHMMDTVYEESQKIMYIGDKENSNTDSALVSTKRSLVFNELNKQLYKKFFLTVEERQAINDGYIYIHDMSARRDTMNCCLFNVAEVMRGGFEMGNVWYNEPKTLDTAFDVIGDITLSAASQEYGGFTLPQIDEVLVPYAEKSYEKYKREFYDIADNLLDYRHSDFEQKAHDYAMRKVERDMAQGYQGLEYKFNTVSSSRGDYPFITITFGLGTDSFAKMASKTFLRVHREGQGKDGNKKPVLFPKLVFLYTEELHGKGKVNEDLFEEGIKTSAKTMYPDWLSLDGDTTVSKMYHKYGKVISPMGKCKSAHVKRY